MRPQLYVSGVVAVMHLCLLVLFVHALRFGVFGAAVATSISLTLNTILMVVSIRTCLRRSVPMVRPSRASLSRLVTFLRLGLPGVLMMGEWWASELAILIAGRLPDAALALSSMSIYQLVNAVCFMLPLGLSVAGATRVGAALGAGDAGQAKRAAMVCVGLGLSVATSTSLILLLGRKYAAAAFTSDAEVQAVLRDELLPRLAAYIIADAAQVCCSGVLQGCGRQHQGAPCVVVAYYCVGLPTACALAFGARQGVAGMVTGMLIGKSCHALSFAWLAMRSNWEAQVQMAKSRVGGEAAVREGGPEDAGAAAGSEMVAAADGAETLKPPHTPPNELAVRTAKISSTQAESTSKAAAGSGPRTTRAAERYAKLEEE